MIRESDVRKALVHGARSMGLQAQAIESGTTGLGIPDIYVRTRRSSAWIELKRVRSRIKCPMHVPFKPGQYEWLSQHWQLGGTSVLVVAFDDCLCVLRDEQIEREYATLDDLTRGLVQASLNVRELVNFIDEPRFHLCRGDDK